jgi:hypothetical protein
MAPLCLFLALLLPPQVCLSQQPSKTSQASLMDLHGPVRTVVMETFDYVFGSKGPQVVPTLLSMIQKATSWNQAATTPKVP